MTELDDQVLLYAFVHHGSEAAFATLVSRYVNLVYSVGLRCTHNTHQAEEIAQAVFITLARKAPRMSPHVILSGWLYQTTRLTAANFIKRDIRRQRREQEAYMKSTLNETETLAWEKIAPLLEEAMGRLNPLDRNALVLHYFENKTAAEVGRALGAGEEAAKKRVHRALDKLRKYFTKRGLTLSTAAIAGAVSANAVQAAPATLAHTISAVAVTKAAASATSTITLVKGVLKLMAWTKTKTAIIVGAGALLATGTITILVKENLLHTDRPEPGGLTQIQITGTPNAVVTGFYVQNGRQIMVSNSLPLVFSGLNFTEFEFHKTNPSDIVALAFEYQGNGTHARATPTLDSKLSWIKGQIDNGVATQSYP